MDLGLGGKTALVTAASKGLGRAIATELAREGARVVISSRDEASLAATASEIRGETGAEVEYRAADLTKAADIEALVAHAVDRFGGIDVLVNNTGGPPTGNFADLDDGAWDLAFRQIILSLVRCVRGVLPSMRERGGGRIVNVASSSVKQPIDNLLLSNTFRAGLAGLAKSLALEFAPDGILVNTLGPGRILTGRTESVDAGQAESQGVSVEEVRDPDTARALRHAPGVRPRRRLSGLAGQRLRDGAGRPGGRGYGQGALRSRTTYRGFSVGAARIEHEHACGAAPVMVSWNNARTTPGENPNPGYTPRP